MTPRRPIAPTYAVPAGGAADPSSTENRPIAGTPRLPDWPERLAAAIDAARARRFVWGVHDCCLFAADCVAAITGIDVAADWRGRYHDEAAMRALLAARGWQRLSCLVAAALETRGWPRIAPGHARRGDVIAVPTDGAGEIAVGVMIGAGALMADRIGVTRLHRRRATHAWAIGGPA